MDRRFSGRGLGTKLFARALADALQAFETVRFVAVIVDALAEVNLAFYESLGFIPRSWHDQQAFLPASTLVEITER